MIENLLLGVKQRETGESQYILTAPGHTQTTQLPLSKSLRFGVNRSMTLSSS